MRSIGRPTPPRRTREVRLYALEHELAADVAVVAVQVRRVDLVERIELAHDLYPSIYWTMWCEMGASKIQRFVLEEVRRAVEMRRA